MIDAASDNTDKLLPQPLESARSRVVVRQLLELAELIDGKCFRLRVVR